MYLLLGCLSCLAQDKSFSSTPKREKNLKSIGMLTTNITDFLWIDYLIYLCFNELGMINKQRTPAGLEHAEKAANIEGDRQLSYWSFLLINL